jgi:rod shape-determining protein MreC
MPQLTQSGPTNTRLKRRDAADNGLRLTIVLVVVSIVLFTISGREGGVGPLSTVRNVFQVITSPVRTLGAVATVPFQGLGNIASNLTADEATLQELKARNAELEARCAELEEQAASAERLQGLLDLQSSFKLASTAARIISGSTDSWTSTVTIDKGTLAGVSVGMPVTASGGVIGQTIQCGPTSSVVRLLDDENSSVSAMLQSSRAQGMLKGSVDGSIHLTLIGVDQTVEVGDAIVTSGLGGVFPKGLPLGRVSSVNHVTGALYLDIEVSLLASAESFEEVLVITSLTDDQQASSEEIAAADAQDVSDMGGVTVAPTDSSSGSSDEGDASSEDFDAETDEYSDYDAAADEGY